MDKGKHVFIQFDCSEMTSSEEKASAEISSIIRSSIKKKLIEMGEEIDDELPDYILLMIGWCLYSFTFCFNDIFCVGTDYITHG